MNAERFTGQVALVTGAARGQGRNHAVALAREGADIIAIDICREIESVPYPLGTREELAETAAQVMALGRRVVTAEVDVRDPDAMDVAVAGAVVEQGRLDIVCANAGVVTVMDELLPAQLWRDTIDINLSGVWFTCHAAIPHMSGGGSIIITSSVAGLKGFPRAVHYSAAKHGLIGLTRALARELVDRRIRVNAVCPTNVLTPMIDNEYMRKNFRPDLDAPTLEDAAVTLRSHCMWGEAWIEPADVTNAVLFLASAEGRFITGAALPVDMGAATT